MCESSFYLCVCPPNTVCAWFLPAVMLRWSSDNMFSWSDRQLLLCFFIVVGNQWVKREIGEFEKEISEIWAPWTWEPYSFLPSASASKPILAAWNSNQKVGKLWTAKNSSQKLKRVRKRIFSGTPRSVTPSLWRQTVQEKYTLAPVWGL